MESAIFLQWTDYTWLYMRRDASTVFCWINVPASINVPPTFDFTWPYLMNYWTDPNHLFSTFQHSQFHWNQTWVKVCFLHPRLAHLFSNIRYNEISISKTVSHKIHKIFWHELTYRCPTSEGRVISHNHTFTANIRRIFLKGGALTGENTIPRYLHSPA